jgi:hypothetical protein
MCVRMHVCVYAWVCAYVCMCACMHGCVRCFNFWNCMRVSTSSPVCETHPLALLRECMYVCKHSVLAFVGKHVCVHYIFVNVCVYV